MTPFDAEERRIREVYQGYREDPHVLTRWDGSNPGNVKIQAERWAGVERLLREAGLLPLAKQKILEVGCGSGGSLAAFLALGATPSNLFGIDLLEKRILEAQTRYPQLTFAVGHGDALPYANGEFDMVLFSTVFSSILDSALRWRVAAEASRILKAGGAILWYDFRLNNPYNAHVRGLRRRHVAELFPDCVADLRSLTLVPPLARKLGSLTPLLYPVLASVPFLRTHYLGLIRRRP